jgi:hypothetical protein
VRRDDVIEWQSAWPIRATTARGLQGALAPKAYCWVGCQEDRAFGVTEAAPGLGFRGFGFRVLGLGFRHIAGWGAKRWRGRDGTAGAA